MKVLSFNCRGLASPHKKSSLKRLVLRVNPKVIFLQETLGTSEVIKELLWNLFPSWEFLVLYARGRLGGLATGWQVASCHLSNSWGSESCLGTDLYSQELNSEFSLFNVYGPYHNRVAFWDNLFSNSLFSHEQVIMGGYLNCSLGIAEIWGSRAIPNPLSDFFKSHLIQKDLIDLDPIKLNPTWRNRRVGEDKIAKRLDHFLIGDSIAYSQSIQSRQWVDWGGEFDHSLILLEVKGGTHKPPSPFKFNASWFSNPEFCDLLKTNWVHLNDQEGSRVGYLFMENLKRLKKVTLLWAKAKKEREDAKLIEIEDWLDTNMSRDTLGFLSEESKALLVLKEKR